mmetsp:Transcript_70802/g.223657  ORF Transcript_70802/g.223657 Transcript_70802/m.223657 type:complete len:568 (-) Transcript_70802:231-1934(-)
MGPRARRRRAGDRWSGMVPGRPGGGLRSRLQHGDPAGRWAGGVHRPHVDSGPRAPREGLRRRRRRRCPRRGGSCRLEQRGRSDGGHRLQDEGPSGRGAEAARGAGRHMCGRLASRPPHWRRHGSSACVGLAARPPALEALPVELAAGPRGVVVGFPGDPLHRADRGGLHRRGRAHDVRAEGRLAASPPLRAARRGPGARAERLAPPGPRAAEGPEEPLLHPLDALPRHLHARALPLVHVEAQRPRPGVLHARRLPRPAQRPAPPVLRPRAHLGPQGGARPQGLLPRALRVPERRRGVVDRAVLRGGAEQLQHRAHEDPPPVAQRRRRRAHQLGPRPHGAQLVLHLHAPLHPVLDRPEPSGPPGEAQGVEPVEAVASRHGDVLRRHLGAVLLEPRLLHRLLGVSAHGGLCLALRHLLPVARLCGGVRSGQSVRELGDRLGWARQHLERGLSRCAPPCPRLPLDRRPRALRGAESPVCRGHGDHLPRHRGGHAAEVALPEGLRQDGRALRGPRRQDDARGEEGAHRAEAAGDRRGDRPRREADPAGLGHHGDHSHLRVGGVSGQACPFP